MLASKDVDLGASGDDLAVETGDERHKGFAVLMVLGLVANGDLNNKVIVFEQLLEASASRERRDQITTTEEQVAGGRLVRVDEPLGLFRLTLPRASTVRITIPGASSRCGFVVLRGFCAIGFDLFSVGEGRLGGGSKGHARLRQDRSRGEKSDDDDELCHP